MTLAIEQDGKSGKDSESGGFSPRPYIIVGYVTLALTFGVFGTWAATAPLSSAVISTGVVSVESNRKSIQHLEGGIVEEIYVTEGDIVEAGEPLVRLDDTQAQGNYAVLNTRQTILRATEARLLAESVNADEIAFPSDLLESTDGQAIAAVSLQRTLFADRKATKDGQVDILRVRIEQLNEQISGLQTQLEATESQRNSITAEVERLTTGQESGVVATNQLSQLTRQQMELQGEYGAITAEIAQIRQNIAETELQIVQITQEFKERAGSEMRDIRDQLNEVSERVIQAADVLTRTTIRTPVRGMVQGIRIHTRQGVIQSAEPIMDIIPLEDDLIVNARIRPLDIDSVETGATAEVRFAAFQSRTTPVIFGHIETLSQDVIQPEDQRAEPYYQARVRVAEGDVPEEIRGRLMPGMPADVIITTGARTMVQYLIKPLEDAFVKGMREQ